MLQYKYCIAGWKASWLGGKLYRNTVHCIAAKRGLKGWVLYYNTLLCIARDLVGEAVWVTIQTLYHDCSHWKGKGKRLECIARQACDTASHARHSATIRRPALRHDRRPGHDTARHARACACLGGLAGPAGCALGAPSLFLTQYYS